MSVYPVVTQLGPVTLYSFAVMWFLGRLACLCAFLYVLRQDWTEPEREGAPAWSIPLLATATVLLPFLSVPVLFVVWLLGRHRKTLLVLWIWPVVVLVARVASSLVWGLVHIDFVLSVGPRSLVSGPRYLAIDVVVVLVAVGLLRLLGQLPFRRVLDVLVGPVVMAFGVGRLGCFLAGCHYGRLWDGPLAVVFPAGSPAARGHQELGLLPADPVPSLSVVPIQLVATLGYALLGAASLTWVASRRGVAGVPSALTLSAFLVVHLALRPLYAEPGGWVGAAVGAVILAGVAGLVWMIGRRDRSPAGDVGEP